jgi:DNA-binding CsgD family transcriptional regulator
MTTPGYTLDREDGLTKRERWVLGMLRAGKTQVEIAEVLKVTKQRVGQIVRALKNKGVDIDADKGGSE